MMLRPGPPPLRSHPGTRPWALLLLAGGLLAGPALAAPPRDREESTRISPALDLLPEGSTLKTVSIPRYDENKNPAALLRAGLMKVITEKHVSGQNVELRVFKTSGEQRLKVHMGAAEYFVTDGILNASEVLTISGNGIKARGTGAIFHLDSRQAFIHGPVTTVLSPDPTKNPDAMNARSRPLASAALLGLAVLAVAAPEPVPPGELDLFAQQTRTQAGTLLAEVAPTRQIITRDDQLAQAMDIGFRAFARKIKRPELLAIAIAEPLRPPSPEPDPKGILITCDGGMYLDIDKGQVVYLKNIAVKHPTFALDCAAELKIFLEQKAPAADKEKPSPADKEKPSPADKEKPSPADKAKPSVTGAFGDIKNLVATGGVKVVRENDKGEALVTTADTASYDAKTGDIILRGGFPMVRQGKNFVRAREAGLYIRIYKNGNVYAQPGKWETGITDIKKLNADP